MGANIAAQGGQSQVNLFEIESNYDRPKLDLAGGIIELNYYESILDTTIRASATLADTGYGKDKDRSAVFEKDDINITSGEKINLKVKDGYENELNFIDKNHLCVHQDPNLTVESVNKVIFSIDMYSKECIDNKDADNWVYGRYDGKITDSVESILKNCLKTPKKIFTDPGLNSFNFLGHAEKPLYLCTLLGKKCVPDLQDALGNLAGYLFYETYDGYNFRSIDKLFTQNPKKNFIFNEIIGEIPPKYDAKILDYSFVGAINLNSAVTTGAFTRIRKQEFNRMKNTYDENSHSSENSYKIYNNGGKEQDIIAKHTKIQEKVTRHTNALMSDDGILPSGFSLSQQIPLSKQPNYNMDEILRQSTMRYNQLFSHKLSIAIPGDFTLRAGDLVFCDFPEVSGKTNRVVSQKISGIYMIADVGHHITKNSCYTRMNLVRDSIYRKPFK
jgi:hypothetical protein